MKATTMNNHAVTPLSNLGKRIVILGRSCAGKSTLAQSLSDALGFSVCHLDQIAHIDHTDWERRCHDAFVQDHDRFITQDYWIIEGNYSATMPQRLSRATSVIFLDFPTAGFIFKYFWRSFKTALFPKTRIGAIQGAKSEFSLSLIHYVLKNYPKNQRKYHEYIQRFAQHIDHVYVIRNTKELNNLYGTLGLARVNKK